ncbi:hypothetical protein [Sulfurimonas sp.]
MKHTKILKLSTLILISVSSLFAQENMQSYDVIIKIPQVPEVPKATTEIPKVILLDSNNNDISNKVVKDVHEYRKKRKVEFSKNVAPEKYALKPPSKKNDDSLVGEIDNGRVAAYLHAPLMSVEDATQKLQEAGFEILSTFKIDRKGSVSSIVFSNKAIEKAAAKKTRGFASNLRLVVDHKNKLVSISNPIYVMKAFMQKEYNEKLAEDTLKQLRNTFTNVKNSSEIVKFRVLERFHFMENMPYYQDMKLISKGKNKTLLKKAKKSKKVVYEQHLQNGSIIIGVKLGKRTSKFVKKIGYQNAGLLPYPVLIENGEAKILAPQYYIAVMYPMLKMSQFMTIATVPGAIIKDVDKIFR